MKTEIKGGTCNTHLAHDIKSAVNTHHISYIIHMILHKKYSLYITYIKSHINILYVSCMKTQL